MRSTSNRGLRVLLLSLVALVATFAWLVRSAYHDSPPGTEIRLDTAYRLAEERRILEVTLLDEDAQAVGRACLDQPAAPPAAAPTTLPEGAPPPDGAAAPDVAPAPRPACEGQIGRFHVSYPRSDVSTQELIDRIRTGGAEVIVDKQSAKAVTKLVVTFVLPLLLLANLFGLIFMSRSGESSIADVAGFGTIRRKRQRRRHSGTGVSFDDVAGAEEAVAELKEVTDYLTDPGRFEAYGAAPPKGVLLFGPPGCGKTLLARAVAGESGVPFFSISGAEFVESLVGVGAARVRDLFRQVREEAPAIVFIDEIDAVGRRRGGEGSTGGEREQTVNQLLVEMDGFEISSGIVLMGATNRPDILDPALLRPGRFDRHVTLVAPDHNGREAILRVHARSRPLSPDVDFAQLARRTPGFTGADLANVINEAALLALRGGGDAQIRMANLTEAIQRVRHGPQRRGRILTAEERRRIAFHESGHAVVAAAMGQAASVQRVSIVARGRGLGQSLVTDEADRALLTADELESQLAVAMGGIAAEVLVFGRSSTTAEDDIERATNLAREMVGLYGMSPRIGRMRLLNRFDGYLAGEDASLEAVSATTMDQFDDEVRRLLVWAEETAASVLSRERAHLDDMAAVLEEHESLEGSALEPLLAVVRPFVPAGPEARTRAPTAVKRPAKGR